MAPDQRLDSYRELVLRWNSRVALVSRKTPAESLDRLIRHALAGERALPSELATLIDVGSGAGLPGIPIALRRPQLEVRLVERGANKATFLREAVRRLGIENATVVEEEFDPAALSARRPLAITAIALGGYRELACEAAPALEPGDGLLLFVKRGLAAEIAVELHSESWSWDLLAGSARTGVAWIGAGNRM